MSSKQYTTHHDAFNAGWAARAAVPQARICKAQRSGVGGSDPQDCDWPFCDCDPKAEKVIEAIEESGFAVVNVHEWQEVLCCVAQVFDGWHNDGTAWSEWDESVRKRVGELQQKLENANAKS